MSNNCYECIYWRRVPDIQIEIGSHTSIVHALEKGVCLELLIRALQVNPDLMVRNWSIAQLPIKWTGPGEVCDYHRHRMDEK